MIAEERETSIAYTAADEYCQVYSCIRKDITAMKSKDAFELIDEGEYEDGTWWATFRIPMAKFSIARAAKTTRNLSDEQRASISARMRKFHGTENLTESLDM